MTFFSKKKTSPSENKNSILVNVNFSLDLSYNINHMNGVYKRRFIKKFSKIGTIMP